MELDEVDEIVSPPALDTSQRHVAQNPDSLPSADHPHTHTCAQIDQLEHEGKGKAKLMAQVRAYRQEAKSWKAKAVSRRRSLSLSLPARRLSLESVPRIASKRPANPRGVAASAPGTRPARTDPTLDTRPRSEP